MNSNANFIEQDEVFSRLDGFLLQIYAREIGGCGDEWQILQVFHTDLLIFFMTHDV